MNYTFIDKKTGERASVPLERWVWGVVHKDGTELKQFDDNGFFHQIGEVEQERVKIFTMYQLNNPQKRVDLVVQPGMKLIHKYRNVKPFYSADFIRVYMFGYKLNNQYHYNFILPDDRIVQSPVDNVDLVQFELLRK